MNLAGGRSIGRLIGIMLIVTVAAIIVARSYYGNRNRSVDPRIVLARELYEGYNEYAGTGDYPQVFALLDSIDQIYLSVPHYRMSFELGVLKNNRAAAFLTIALYRDSIPEARNPLNGLTSDSLMQMADSQIREAIGLYDRWNTTFSGLSSDQIREHIRPEFMQGLESADPDLREKYLENRIEEIVEALEENPRRLSVCYTNLGLVYRYRGEYVEAAEQYKKALELWDRNLDAENNLNLLLNKPLRKRNFIQRMFPPSKDASTNH
jgi:tetratricopeptide (TPR) repeat protein